MRIFVGVEAEPSRLSPSVFLRQTKKKKFTGQSFYEVFELEIFKFLNGNRRNSFLSSLYNLLVEFGSILQDIIQY